jgi:hypothetical protein
MRYNIEINYGKDSIAEFESIQLLSEILNVEGVNRVESSNQNSFTTRSGTLSLIFEILGGAASVLKIYDFIYQRISKKQIGITVIIIKKEDGHKLIITSNKEANTIKNEITEFFLEEMQK